MKLIANASLTLAVEFDPVAGGELSPAGIIAIVSPIPSVKVKAEGGGCYFGAMSVTVTGITNSSKGATVPPTNPISLTIQPSSTTVKSGGMFALLEGDSISGTASPTTPSGAVVATPFTLKVQSAGQTKVKAN